MDKLIKQLQRDFKKNPKKVVLLGVLVVVCLWVVVPLFLPKEELKPVRRTPAAAVAASPTASGAVAAAAMPTLRWQDLDRALKEDKRMRSAGHESEIADVPPRNPFETPFDVDAAFDELVAEVNAETEAENAVTAKTATAESIPVQRRFDDVSLELSSTIIGAQAVAVINGRTFHEGDRIGMLYGRPVELQSIEPRSAVVAWNGVTRKLEIPLPNQTAPQASLAGTRRTP